MNLRLNVAGLLPVLAVALAAGCKERGQPTPEVKPRDATPAERAHAVAQLPAGFREGLAGPESEVARQLGLQVWAFEFKGGPFGCWIDLAEDGQQTARSPHGRNPQTRIGCDGDEGVLLFWFLPRTTPQMPQPLKDRLLGNTPQVPNLFVGLATNGKKTLDMSQYDNPDKPIVPLWFGWKDADVREQPRGATLKPGEAADVLVIEATEKGAEGKPRKVKLSLTAVK